MSDAPAQKGGLDPRGRPYCPYGAARDLFYDKSPEMLIEGPAGTGKTRGVLEKANLCLLKYPGCRILAVRKTRASMTESVLVTYEQKVVPEGASWIANQTRRTRSSYEYPNGSSLVIGGMDNPDRIMSTEYDAILAFEATELTEDDWEKCTSRLRNHVIPYQQGIADCNPGPPTHWLNQRANAKRMVRLLSRHEDNPVFYRAGNWTDAGRQYVEGTLARLTGARYHRLRRGVWAAAEGLVFDSYNADVHLIDRFEIPPHWRRIRSVDFGFTNAFVTLWIAFDEDDRMYVYRQLYKTKTLVQDHAQRIKELSEGETFDATVADHDAEDRATLLKYGIPTVPAKKEVKPGLEAVSLRFRQAGDGRPRLFILRDSLVEKDAALVDAKLPTCLEEEIDGYVWQPPTEGKAPKEEPVKMNDHACDALRYACMYRRLAKRSGEIIIMGSDPYSMR